MAIAAPVVDDPEKVLAPLTIRFAEVLRGAIQSSREEVSRVLCTQSCAWTRLHCSWMWHRFAAVAGLASGIKL